MSPRLKSGLAIAGSFLLGGGLLYLALRGADFAAVRDALRGGAWGWLVPLFVVSVASVAIRAWRWRLLLNALPGKDTPTRPPVTFEVTFVSVTIGYLVNYAAPRLGEFARAANVSTRSDRTFPAVFGTVVAERVLDVLTLGLALLLVAVLYGSRLDGIWAAFGEGIASALASIPELSPGVILGLVLGGIAVLALVWAAVRRAQSGLGGRLLGLADQFRQGIVALLRCRQRVALALSTLLMWGCYVLMADIPLRLLGLSATYGLSLLDAFALMAVGAVGMSLPSPGGAGSYHYATVLALTVLFGVAASPAAAYAVIGHAAQLLFYCVAGVAALLWQGTSLSAIRTSAESVQAAGSAPTSAP
ncbi:MAG: lysylphosphatidylglycerol synthase transmembrane domain-containing protein [Bacteroidota bacterium]